MKKRLPRLADDVLPRLALKLRALGPDDRPLLLAYYQRLTLTERRAQFGFSLADDRLARFVDGLNLAEDGHFAAMGAASVVIGVAHCTVFDGQGVVSVNVAPGYRRRAVATGLVEAVTGFARTRGLAWLRAYFSKDDPIAAALARRCGMQLHVGLDRFYAELKLLPAPGVPRPAPAAPALADVVTT